MSVSYTGVQWNRQKRIYDLWLGLLLLLTVGAYVGVSVATHPRITAETLILRSTALAAFLLLHIILCIGPLARLDQRFLPLLYNRRHLGVVMFFLGLVHAALAVFQFHGLGDENPLVSVFTAYRRDYTAWIGGFGELVHFPFEIFGVGALVILFFMAVTSHDFWLRNLGPSFWKSLHLAVLAAYGLLVLHVAYGVLQSEVSPLYPVLLGLGLALVLALHLLAGLKERDRFRSRRHPAEEGYEAACRVAELREGEGKVVLVGGQRRAVYLNHGKVFALSNVCRHQGGPLGEGRIVDGVITCPWHGWQYRPEDGCSPPPFTEVVPTYRVRVADGTVWIHPQPKPLANPGCKVDLNRLAALGAPIEAVGPGRSKTGRPPFYVGYLPKAPVDLARFVRAWVILLAVTLPVLAAAVAWAQGRFEVGTFEFGTQRSFEGVLYETPVPMLRLGVFAGAGDSAGSSVLLVGSGKQGLPAFARGHHGERVTFDGTLIYRRGLAMIEMNAPETFFVVGPAPDPPRVEQRGEVVLTGELVDTKCFSGVMRPATGKVHRACAVRCLSGGIPPGLLVRGDDGSGTVFVLAGQGDEPLDYDVQWAARRVWVRGDLEILDGVPLVRVEDLRLGR
jgi:nitrite reductase/ring-hydroxylating ferredoxin subunit/DMSO/TMAO reductase YedYZ heme-binding membrane subunit